MKKLLLSTAILGTLAVPALAQDQTETQTQEIFRQAPDALEIRASDFMGMRVYASETAVEGEEIQGVQEGWNDLGEINDIIVDREGMVQAVLVDIGGFLGIGERQVALTMDSLQFLSDSATAEDADDFFLVVNATRESLEAAPDYSGGGEGEMTAEQAAQETEQAVEEGGSDMAAAGAAAGAAVGAAAGAAAGAVGNAGEAVADTAGDAAQATGEAVTDTAQTAENAIEGAATETEMEADQTAQAAMDGTATTDQTAETDTTTAATGTDMAGSEQTATAEGTTTPPEAGDTTVTEVTPEQTATVDDTTTTTGVTNTEQTSAEARTPVAREGFVTAGAEDMTADRLQGAAVYDVNDERVGEVGEIILSQDGQVQDLVIDVGGFLGIGEKPVALGMQSVDILRQDGGEEIRVYVSQAREELEGMPTYEAQ